jgi:hypothetical protein
VHFDRHQVFWTIGYILCSSLALRSAATAMVLRAILAK